MVRNYFLVATRNLTRNKFFSAINIFGLAVSMSICMAIIMLVADQITYDRHNPMHDRIYRVNTVMVDHNGVATRSVENATSPMPLRDELLENYTGIEKAVRIKRGFANHWLELEKHDVNIPLKGYFADPETLEFFGHELLYGDPLTALEAPYSIVVTAGAARKLFREENPVGLTVKVGETGVYTVTGVLKETDTKSHLVFEALASMSTVKSLQAEGTMGNDLENWLDFWDGWSYIMLGPGKTTADIVPQLEKIYEQHIAPAGNRDTPKAKFSLQGLTEITPGPMVNNPIGPSLPWAFVYFLSGLAAVIMLTSCFNFTNLSVARSLKRAKEIGVRKVTGAMRWQIFSQFLVESVVVSLCALIIAVMLLIVVKPLILQLTFAKLFMWDLEANYVVFLIFLLFAVLVGILAGFFPAVVLSGFQPIKVLKNFYPVKIFSSMGLRKSLLVTQFTVSLVFILTVIVMYNQLELFLRTDYGFNMKNNLMVRLNQTSSEKLKHELLKYSNVKNVTAASHIPAAGETHGNGFKKELHEKEWTNLNTFSVDEDYLTNMEVGLIAGKFFKSENGRSNKNFTVINEQALKVLHYENAHDAIGEEIIYQSDSSRKEIIGVVKDYNHNQLFSHIDPLALMYDSASYALLQVRYTGNREDAVKSLEKAWSQINPDLKIDYKDVEAEIKFFYNTIFGDVVHILGVIALLAIMISCLGLLGMATYTIESRMKEISIRKVLGSSDGQLILLLSKGFLNLLTIAIFLGIPLAWFLNNLWLDFIAYHTEIGFGVIAMGALILIFLGGVTIGSQTLRAAFTNPVDNLKNE
ncbi:MAG TPA: ABC transporter permease [Chryseosolibacter sp.]